LGTHNVLIVGAGVCGMTLGYKLAQTGHTVTIVESHEQVGGLARTFRYDGFAFDSGPHRFFSSNPEVIQFLKEVFGEDLLSSPMRSAVHFLGRYFDWPLSLKVIFRLPPSLVFGVIRDFFRAPVKEEPRHFKDYIIQRYGRTLYELDFGPYTEKFTKESNEDIHPDWAKAGVNRAVIKEDIRMKSLWEVIRSSLVPKRDIPIYYPRTGISEFHERLRRGIIGHGGRIILNAPVIDMTTHGDRIHTVKIAPGRRTLTFDTLVWTAPIGELNRFLGIGPFDLNYLNIVTFNLLCKGKPKKDYQWIYYVDEDIPFNRLYNTVLFSPQCAPPDHHGICVEMTCRKDDEVWTNPARFDSRVLTALERVNVIDGPDQVRNIRHEHLRDAYPIYKTNYRAELDRNLKRLYRYSNLIPAGRTGLCWYNNMDHSIENAFQVARDIGAGTRSIEVIDFWEPQ